MIHLKRKYPEQSHKADQRRKGQEEIRGVLLLKEGVVMGAVNVNKITQALLT